MVNLRLVKSTPPASKPTTGMMISLTRELTMAVKAPPTATPTARSTTEPRLMNSMNSLRKLDSFFFTVSNFTGFLSVFSIFDPFFNGLIGFRKIIKIVV